MLKDLGFMLYIFLCNEIVFWKLLVFELFEGEVMLFDCLFLRLNFCWRVNFWGLGGGVIVKF